MRCCVPCWKRRADSASAALADPYASAGGAAAAGHGCIMCVVYGWGPGVVVVIHANHARDVDDPQVRH